MGTVLFMLFALKDTDLGDKAVIFQGDIRFGFQQCYTIHRYKDSDSFHLFTKVFYHSEAAAVESFIKLWNIKTAERR